MATKKGKRDLRAVKLSATEWARIESVAERSETSVEAWLRSAILANVACDEAHFEETARRDEAAKAVDREKIRRLLNKNGFGSEPSKETLDILTEQIAVARADGRAGLEMVARAARSVKIAADLAFGEV